MNLKPVISFLASAIVALSLFTASATAAQPSVPILAQSSAPAPLASEPVAAEANDGDGEDAAAETPDSQPATAQVVGRPNYKAELAPNSEGESFFFAFVVFLMIAIGVPILGWIVFSRIAKQSVDDFDDESPTASRFSVQLDRREDTASVVSAVPVRSAVMMPRQTSAAGFGRKI